MESNGWVMWKMGTWLMTHLYHGYVKPWPQLVGSWDHSEDWNSSWPARGNALWSRRRLCGSFGLKSRRSPCKDEERSKVNQILTESSGKTIYIYIYLYLNLFADVIFHYVKHLSRSLNTSRGIRSLAFVADLLRDSAIADMMNYMIIFICISLSLYIYIYPIISIYINFVSIVDQYGSFHQNEPSSIGPPGHPTPGRQHPTPRAPAISAEVPHRSGRGASTPEFWDGLRPTETEEILHQLVDEQNPTRIPHDLQCFIGTNSYELVQDFVHPQYVYYETMG